MHEFGIAQGLLETVLNRAESAGANEIQWIKLEIGVLAGVEEEALTFAFTALSEGTKAGHAKLLIEKIPLRCQCHACGHPFTCRPFAYRCPKCGISSNNVISGKEMNLVAMEVN